jgi:hypothetical protein
VNNIVSNKEKDALQLHHRVLKKPSCNLHVKSSTKELYIHYKKTKAFLLHFMVVDDQKRHVWLQPFAVKMNQSMRTRWLTLPLGISGHFCSQGAVSYRFWTSVGNLHRDFGYMTMQSHLIVTGISHIQHCCFLQCDCL